MLRRSILVVLFILSGNIAVAAVQVVPDPQRGELLYSTHCIACHTTEIHWRDKKLTKDFKSLSAEVNRWQKLGGLGWGTEDISAVARYLNRLHYHYPEL
jgi:mono/diheme cytochrome c family protein